MSSFLQAIIDPKKNVFARTHMKAVSSRLRKYGLRYNLCDPYYDIDIKVVMNQLPREIINTWNQRLKRAMELSMKHEYLTKDVQTTLTQKGSMVWGRFIHQQLNHCAKGSLPGFTQAHTYYTQVPSHNQGDCNWSNSQSMNQFQQEVSVRNSENYSQGWQNPSTGQYWTNSNYHNSMPSSQSGNSLYSNTTEPEPDVTIEDFDTYCKEGKLKEAVYMMKSLTNKGYVLDVPRLLGLMQLCGEVEALQEAKSVHEHFSASVSLSDVTTLNKIIKVYSNCGSIDDALRLFEKMQVKNLETWCSMMRCLAKNGCGEEAIDMFTRFKKEGNRPEGEIFKELFFACGVLCDMKEGLLHFESMYKDYGIIPEMDHYISVVEMLASPGYLDAALEFVEKMPIEPNVDVWEALMNLSRVHGDLELGNRCAELVEQLDATRLNEQSKMGLLPVKASDIAKEKLKKASGIRNSLEIKCKVHEFRAGDTAHPDNDKLYGLLRSLKAQMVEMGYVPDLRYVLHDVDPETKEDALLAHSERLAFAQGLLTTPARSTIRVIKNLRVCIDCHNALKIMSKIVGREFIMRDAKRFHHLKDGVCSCNDYW